MEFTIATILICFLIYLLNSYLFNYWKRLNVPQLNAKFIFGNLSDMLNVSMGEGFMKLYEKTKHEKFMGFYLSYKPCLLINEPQLIQHVMIKDFSTFHDRPMPSNEKDDPISGHLFSLHGQRWRELRVKLTPTFTSGKLKMMFPVLKDCGDVLVDFIKNNKSQNIYDARDLFSRFTINVISSVGFGVDNDCINEPDNVFRKIGMEIFDLGIVQKIRFSVIFLIPKLYHLFNIRITSKRVENFLKTLVRQTIEYREKNNIRRNDFMDMMIQLKNNGFLSADKGENDNEDKSEKRGSVKLTENEIMAQAFIFFGAGGAF